MFKIKVYTKVTWIWIFSFSFLLELGIWKWVCLIFFMTNEYLKNSNS